MSEQQPMENASSFGTDFFAEAPPTARSKVNNVVGGIGSWILHFIKVGLLCYTSYHAIHAAMLFASTPLAKTFQIIGFISIDLTLLGIYIAYLNKKFTGTAQKVASGIVYILCLAIAAIAVVIDSQISLNGVNSLSGFTVTYFNFILPIAPLLAGIGSAVIHVLDEDNKADQAQISQHVHANRRLNDAKFKAMIAEQAAELKVQKMVKNMQLASRLHVAKSLHTVVQQPAVLQQLQAQAEGDLPRLLSAAGIDIGRFSFEQHGQQLPPQLGQPFPQSPQQITQPTYYPSPEQGDEDFFLEELEEAFELDDLLEAEMPNKQERLQKIAEIFGRDAPLTATPLHQPMPRPTAETPPQIGGDPFNSRPLQERQDHSGK